VPQLALRIPSDNLHAADEIADTRNRQAKNRGHPLRHTRSSILREAIARGLQRMAKQASPTPRARPRKLRQTA
jgi:hypothetical protein